MGTMRGKGYAHRGQAWAVAAAGLLSLHGGTASAKTVVFAGAIGALPPTAEAGAGADFTRPSARFEPGRQLAPALAVRISRAADLVGSPMRLASPKVASPAAARPGVPRPIAPGLSLPGAMPLGMPVAARALTSGFGPRQHPLLGGRRAHAGLDLAAPSGSPIVATSDGVVGSGGWAGGYGLLVTLDHGGGVQTRYGHMSRVNVLPGQQVRRGDVIGYVGSTGMSTGPHLHYEVRIGGQPVNPIGTLGGR